MLKLYSDLATWWPLLSPLKEYESEACFFLQILSESGLPTLPSFLELGCGGGSNAFYLKKIFSQVTLTDISPHMLAVSQNLNVDCEHLEGDMRTMRLGRLFDVVFVHDAIEYMVTLQDLQQAIETAFVHCRLGGKALFIPDHVSETFQPSTDHGGSGGDGRELRYLEWAYDPDDTDNSYIVEFAYLLQEGDQPARVEHEQHTFGLFSLAQWLQLLSEVGFESEIIRDQHGRNIFLACKPLPKYV